MGVYGGPNIETNGLVINLDAANNRSFRGEPTTNVVTNTNLDTGWSKEYQTNIVFNEIEPPEGINSPVVGFDRGNSSGYWYSYGDYAPQVPNTVYTVSLYVKTLDSNFTIAFYTADNSETGRVWGSYIAVPANGKWNRIVWPSFTNPSNSQSNSLSFNFTYSGSIGSPSTRTWFCAPQMEAKSYATPFVNGTRGTTVESGGGWADRSGNNNHGELVNGVTYNSSNLGSLVFDGVNDYITIPSSNLFAFGTSDFTLEIWIYPESFSSYTHLIALPSQDTFALKANVSDGLIYFYTPSYTTYGSTPGWVLTLNTWNHVVFKRESSVGYTFLNGVSKGSKSGFTNNFSSQILNIHNGIAGEFTQCKISEVKIYNKALTETEILQNFNATKKRYGL